MIDEEDPVPHPHIQIRLTDRSPTAEADHQDVASKNNKNTDDQSKKDVGSGNRSNPRSRDDKTKHDDDGGGAPPGVAQQQPQQATRRRIRAIERVDINALPAQARQRIRALQAAIAQRRPPPSTVPRRAAPRRRAERWRADEDELLLLLRDNGMGYNQIEVSFFFLFFFFLLPSSSPLAGVYGIYLDRESGGQEY